MKIEKYQKLLPRKRLLEGFSKKYNLNHMIILDIGCGEGMMTDFLTKKNVVIGADEFMQGKGLINAKKKGLIPVKLDAEHDLPFYDDSFDAFLCLDMIEHVKNWKKLIKEIYRVTKPDGLLILSTPNVDSIPHKIICHTIGDSHDHVSFFGFNKIQDELRHYFDIVEVDGWTGLKIKNHWIYTNPGIMKRRLTYNTFVIAKCKK